ncbi:MAG: hypothetical protein MUE86_07110 [Thiobacillaceae bacterium]|nr:hypothetical protein [Thiobacillaceae bacterium]
MDKRFGRGDIRGLSKNLTQKVRRLSHQTGKLVYYGSVTVNNQHEGDIPCPWKINKKLPKPFVRPQAMTRN